MQMLPPVTPNRTKGPLGVCQLPRMWSKVLLDARGLLPPGYSAIGDGFDRVVLEGLGLDRERVMTHLRSNLPTYPEFQRWILEELGGSVPDGAAKKINETIMGYTMGESRRKQLLQNAGLEDDGSLTLVVDINEIDDWAEFHSALVLHVPGEGPEKVPPIIPTRAGGPLGICQLPRMWAKVLLDAKGLLPPGYSVIGEGFDKIALDGLGVDRAKVMSYLVDNFPPYPDFQRWILGEIRGRAIQDAREKINDRILGRESARRAELLGHAGYADDGSMRLAVDVNEIDDWAVFHHYLMAS